MWLEGSAQLGDLGQKGLGFAQWAEMKFFGQKLWAKNTNCPDAGTAYNSPI